MLVFLCKSFVSLCLNHSKSKDLLEIIHYSNFDIELSKICRSDFFSFLKGPWGGSCPILGSIGAFLTSRCWCNPYPSQKPGMKMLTLDFGSSLRISKPSARMFSLVCVFIPGLYIYSETWFSLLGRSTPNFVSVDSWYKQRNWASRRKLIVNPIIYIQMLETLENP